MATSRTQINCPIFHTVDLVGDKWSLLILRNMLLWGQTRYNELHRSCENISTNILADRLKKLADRQLIERFRDPDDGKSAIYLPTDKGIDLLPVMLSMAKWGLQHDKSTLVPARLMARLRDGTDVFIETVRGEVAGQRMQLKQGDSRSG